MAAKHTNAQRVKRIQATSALGLACMLGTPVAATAQEPPASSARQIQADQDLTEGLLDLLTEPTPESTTPRRESTGNAAEMQAPPAPGASPAPSTPPRLDGERGLGAKDFGADDLGEGEDLGASRANPLAEVRLGMLTAAGWLRDQRATDKTEQLQRDIVARLDELIADFNQPSPPPSQPPPADAQNPPPSEPQGGSGNKQSEATKGASEQQTTRNAASGDETQADATGTEGQPAPGALERKRIIVDLNDPTALQRSAWGNLPDRVREQMQSRMVERFLPGYREEIEAYYRALSR